MYWELCYVLLSACADMFQIAFDEYTDHFAALVDHAEARLKHNDECATAAPPVLTAEMGVVPPLYYAAMKCRHPILRRRALSLLQIAPRQKGLWGSFAADRVVATVIALEEGDAHTPGAGLREPSEPVRLPPEEDRIHGVAVVSSEGPPAGRRLAVQITKLVSEKDGLKKMVHNNVWLECH
jgi:hypothetical protein